MALTITSPAFDAGDPIPAEYGYTDRNVNPPLAVEGVPDGTESLALVVDDPDAVEPAGKVWDHWVVWNVDPETREIPEDWDPERSGASVGTNDYGEQAYGGPNPPDGEHTYRFELLALETALDLPQSAAAQDVRTAAEGSILASATLDGTYAP